MLRQQSVVKATVDQTIELRSTITDMDVNSRLTISPGKYKTIEYRDRQDEDDIVAYDQISEDKYSIFKTSQMTDIRDSRPSTNPYTYIRNSNIMSKDGEKRPFKTLVVARTIDEIVSNPMLSQKSFFKANSIMESDDPYNSNQSIFVPNDKKDHTLRCSSQ